MMLLDMRTIVFSNVLSYSVCMLVILLLWHQSRKQFAGTDFLVFSFAFQTSALFLIVLRGTIDAWMSVVLANTLVIAGALLAYMGLERFVAKKSSQVHNYVLLAAFACVHTYFTFFQPSLAARTLNVSVGLLIICFQCVWLLWHRVEPGTRGLTLVVGMVFAAYCLVSAVRIAEFFIDMHPRTEYFQPNMFDTFIMVSYQMLFIMLTYGLAIMFNKRLLMDVKTQEEKFSKAFHSSPYAIALTRLSDGRIMEVNEGFLNITGYRYEEVMGKTTPELHLWDRDGDRDGVIQELSESGKVHGREYPFRNRSGEILTGLFSGTIISIEGGKYVLSSISDITDRKRAETALIEAHAKLESRVLERTAELSIANEKLAQEIEESRKAGKALQESNERYRTLIESVTDAVVIVDPDGKLTYLNPECEKISGYRVEELIGRSFTELLPPEHVESTLERFRQGLSGANPPIAEISILHKDGSQVPVEINSTTLLDAEGRLVGRITVIRDISERKRLEAHLLQRQRLESIGILAGGIAHDFDNILSIIMGFTDMAMREVPEKSSARQNLDRALTGIQRAADLVKQITAFSQQSMPARGPVLLSPIAENVASLLRASLPETIEIRLDLQTGTGTVYADPTQIYQVLMNLCTNAAHAMREKGGILDVSLSEVEMDAAALAGLPEISPGDYLRMTVSDTGEGMSPEVLDRIFDPYFSTKERGEGTGLGLSVIHGIMKSHGGAITVRSKPRKGTTFHVYLPLLKHRAELEEQIGVFEPLPGGNERILFVEDEEDMVFLVGQLLESLGYEVITRANGMDALSLFREQPDRFDLVITDMTLPGMRGERLAEQIKKIRHDTPIILCTGFGEDITEERARKMGIGEIILKPLVNIDLTKTIRKVLDETNVGGN